VIGLGIDAEAKNTVLDVAFVARDGTSLAKQMALQVDAKTNFAGFLLPEASVTISAVSKASPEDLEQIAPQLKMYREQLARQIDDSPDFPAEKRDAAKAVVGQMFGVLEKTLSEGQVDLGGVLLLLPKSLSFGFGGHIADGPAMEKALKDLVNLLKDQPDFPQVQFDAGTLGNVKLHRITAPIPDGEPEARELLGEKLEIVVGIGPKSIIVTGGKDAEGLLKKILDGSAAQASKPVLPMQINVALLPILKFYQSVDDNPIVAGVIASLEQGGGDRIIITSRAGQRSSTGRIEIQEGIIRAAGEAAKAFGAGFDPNAL